MKLLSMIGRTVAGRWRLWLIVTTGFTALYFLGLMAAMVVRFGAFPNYWVVYDVVQAYGLILSGTPALTDALPLLAQEPWLEAGYKNPDYYGIAEWSFMVIPPKLLMIVSVGALLATFVVLRADNRRCASRKGTVAVGLGSALIGLGGATLTWVVCCATPSWVVVLAMLGLSSSLALALEPLGAPVVMLGIVLLVGAIVHQAYRAGQPLIRQETPP